MVKFELSRTVNYVEHFLPLWSYVTLKIFCRNNHDSLRDKTRFKSGKFRSYSVQIKKINFIDFTKIPIIAGFFFSSLFDREINLPHCRNRCKYFSHSVKMEAPSSGGKKSHAWLNVILNVICSDLHFHSQPAREYYLLLVLELHLLLFMEKGRCRVYKFQVKYFEFFRHVGLT